MNSSFRPRRTIDVELSNGKRVWRQASNRAHYQGGRTGIWTVVGSTVLTVGLTAGLCVGAMTLLSQQSLAQPPSFWQPMPPRTTPHDSVPAGMEANLTLYPCRASVLGRNIQLGRYRSDFSGCHVGLNGKELEIQPFEVLGMVWADGGEGVNRDPLVTGTVLLTDAAGQTTSALLFSCRAAFQGGIHPGSLRPREKGCAFGFGGHVIVSENYTIPQAAPWMTWTSASPGALPGGALPAGEEGGEPFYLCRAPAADGLYGGKVKKTSPGCSIPVGQTEVVERRFEVLTTRWQPGNGGAVPVSGIANGRADTNLLFSCRVQSHGTLQLGRVNEPLGGCHVGMQDSEVVFQDYEVLAQ